MATMALIPPVVRAIIHATTTTLAILLQVAVRKVAQVKRILFPINCPKR